MTTIAYRGGVMAADSRAYCGRGEPSFGGKAKIRRLEDGTLIGCSSSSVGGGEVIMDWYAAGQPKIDLVPETFEFMAVKPDGSAFLAKDGLFLSGPIKGSFFAIGSGNAYAFGAMEVHEGVSAAAAVAIAARFDPFTGGDILLLAHGDIA